MNIEAIEKGMQFKDLLEACPFFKVTFNGLMKNPNEKLKYFSFFSYKNTSYYYVKFNSVIKPINIFESPEDKMMPKLFELRIFLGVEGKDADMMALNLSQSPGQFFIGVFDIEIKNYIFIDIENFLLMFVPEDFIDKYLENFIETDFADSNKFVEDNVVKLCRSQYFK